MSCLTMFRSKRAFVILSATHTLALDNFVLMVNIVRGLTGYDTHDKCAVTTRNNVILIKGVSHLLAKASSLILLYQASDEGID